jgi:hypothetical protein
LRLCSAVETDILTPQQAVELVQAPAGIMRDLTAITRKMHLHWLADMDPSDSFRAKQYGQSRSS